MATIADDSVSAKPVSPDAYERLLAFAAIVLLGFVLAALWRGREQWAQVPWQVWPHLATVMVALVLTPVQLLRRRGDPFHRGLGRIWVAAMFLTALLSLNLREINHGHFSLIHLLSVLVLFTAPLLWWSARTHRVAAHRRAARGMVTGALVIAGAFTFPFDRLLGHWLFG